MGFKFYLDDDTTLNFKTGDSQVSKDSNNYTWYIVDRNTALDNFKKMVN